MENKNKPAFATSSPSCKNYDGILQEGLTKLEYFSIKCLQGFLSNDFNITYKQAVSMSVKAAKELLKQLENESTGN